MKSFRGFIVLLLSFFCSIMAYAQKEYDSFLKEGKVWKMEYIPSSIGNDVSGFRYLKLYGDTTISDIPFKRVLIKEWNANEYEPSEWKLSHDLIGEKDCKIYSLTDYSTKGPKVVMDFSLDRGDDFVIYNATFVANTVSDTILIHSDDKFPRRCISVSLKGMNDKYTDTWIEGVGSAKGGLMGIDCLYFMGSSPKLLRCEDNGVCIYFADETTGITVPQLPHINTSLFDLQGRPVKDASRHGIYVKDGRKVIR